MSDMAAPRSTGTCPKRKAERSHVAFYDPAHKSHGITSVSLLSAEVVTKACPVPKEGAPVLALDGG